jgi:hypothetical protein
MDNSQIVLNRRASTQMTSLYVDGIHLYLNNKATMLYKIQQRKTKALCNQSSKQVHICWEPYLLINRLDGIPQGFGRNCR